MTPNFAPHFSPLVTAGLLLITAILLMLSLIFRRRILPRSSMLVLIGLRLAIFLVITLLLLNPFWTEEQPDQRQFRIQFLYDSSGSMETKDVDSGLSRLEKLSEFIASSSFAKFSKQYPFLQQNSFSETLRPWLGQLKVSPGFTMAGAVLGQLNDQDAKLPLGAVVLFSDGNNNQGLSLTDAAKKYQARGIPITTVCLGATSPPKDLSIRVPAEPLKSKLGKSLTVPVFVQNSFDTDQNVVVNCWQQGVLLKKKQVTVKANSEQQVAFDLTPTSAGDKVYRFTTPVLEADSRAENNTAYAMVKVEKSPITKVLLITDSPTPQFRFLSLMLKRQKSTAVSSVLRLSADIIMTDGGAEGLEDIKKEMPNQASFYTQFDVIVTDSKIMNLRSKLLKDFISERGGGLVILDDPELLNKENQTLIPAKSWRLQRNMVSHSLKVADERIFPQQLNEILYSSFGLSVLKYHDFTEFVSPFSYARTPLLLQDKDQALVLAHQYGGGRFVIMNYPKHWRWQLKAMPSDHYKSFWTGLFSWLGSATKPRVDQFFNGQKFPLNQQVALQMLVRNQRYEETSTATVSLTITSPKGVVSDLALSPVLDDLGKYQENFIASEAGEYLVETLVSFYKEEPIALKGSFLVVPTSKEYTDVTAKPAVLQDVARITKGDFYSSCPDEFHSLKVAKSLPKLVTKLFWFDYFPLPLLLLVLFLIDIYVRRRLGLK